MQWRRAGGSWSPEMIQVRLILEGMSGPCPTAGAAPWWPSTGSTSASEHLDHSFCDTWLTLLCIVGPALVKCCLLDHFCNTPLVLCSLLGCCVHSFGAVLSLDFGRVACGAMSGST